MCGDNMGNTLRDLASDTRQSFGSSQSVQGTLGIPGQCQGHFRFSYNVKGNLHSLLSM